MAWSRIEGTKGSVQIRDLGASMAVFRKWTLTRRRNDPDNAREPGDLYDLYAECEFLKTELWNDPDYEKDVQIDVRGKRYRLEQAPGYKTILGGVVFRIEGVRLCRP